MAKEIGKIFQRNDFVIEWNIQNFWGLSVKVDKEYRSPSFPFSNAYWHLRVYPNGTCANTSEGYIDLFLYRETSGPLINLEYSLGLKTVNGNIDPITNYTFIFENPGGYGSACFLKRSILLERKLELARHGAVTVVCTLKDPAPFKASGFDKVVTKECPYCKTTVNAQEDISSHLRKCTEFPIKCPKCSDDVALKNCFDHKCQTTGEEATEKLLRDFKEMMLNGEHSDAIIRVKGEEFRLHRSVLASRSPYFHSMFNCSMKENNTGNVIIDDCQPNVFRSFIHFVYTGKVDKLTIENVCDLYELADKYQEDQLKSECLYFMMSRFSIDSFCDFTVLAFRHDEKELLENAVNFFASNTKEIIRSVKWQTLLMEYPIQANELYIKILS